MEDRFFIEQMEQILELGKQESKSVTIAREDFKNLINIAKKPISQSKAIRSCAIHQSGYGMNGCGICHTTWMIGSNEKSGLHYEKEIHKECVASPE
jgi:hypothetical protein